MINFKFQISNSQRGFTLIEAIVATAVFAFVVSSTIGVYISTTQIDRKSRSSRAVTQNARYIMEFLAKEIGNGSINYAAFPGGLTDAVCFSGVGPCTTLYLTNQAGETEQFVYSPPNIVFTKNGSSVNLNSSGVKVTQLRMAVRPQGDPYTAAKNYNEQPRVTVVLELTSNYGSAPTDTVKLDLQDTFAVRTYPPRQ